MLLGGLLGVWLAPRLLGDADPALWVSLAALFVVLVCASFGQAILQYVGAKIRSRIKWQPVRALDAIGGAALSMAAVLVVAWALGVAISGAKLPWASREVRSSAVLDRVNGVMPADAVQALNSFNDVVGSSFFPRYLEPFAPERIIDVGPPPGRMRRDPDVRRARGASFKIRGDELLQPGRRGQRLPLRTRPRDDQRARRGRRPRPTVSSARTSGRRPSSTTTPTSTSRCSPSTAPAARSCASTRPAGRTRPARCSATRRTAPTTSRPARIRGEQRLRSPDIYGDGTVVREVFSLRALVRPGNSGGPLVSSAGKVLGVIFAASVTDTDTGYALTSQQVAGAAAQGLTRSTDVDTGACA